MSIREDIERKLKERKEAEKRNPLSEMGLGDLIKESQNCIMEAISGNSDNTTYYNSLIAEINRREEKYRKKPSELMRF